MNSLQSKQAKITIDEIKQSFELCLITLERLPIRSIRSYTHYWPDHLYSQREIAWAESRQLKIPALPEDVTQAEQALHWITWVDETQRHLIWMRAEGIPWRRIEGLICLPRTTAQRQYDKALLKIQQQHENN